MHNKPESSIEPSQEPGPLAEFVRYGTADQVFLHALLWQPPRPTKTLVVYVAGFGGGFCGPNDLNPLARTLTAAGHAFMAVNLRTVGPPGMAFSRFEDCATDIDAALQFAERRGFSDLALVGESLGGPRIAYHLATKKPPEVRAVVFLGAILSPYLEAQLRWDPGERARYDEFLQTMRVAVAEGRGREVFSYPFAPGRPLFLSAQTFINSWGPPTDGNVDTPRWCKEIRIPALVLHGSRDSIAVPENARQIHASLAHAARRDLIMVDADHFFMREGDALAYAQPLATWLGEVLPPQPSQEIPT